MIRTNTTRLAVWTSVLPKAALGFGLVISGGAHAEGLDDIEREIKSLQSLLEQQKQELQDLRSAVAANVDAATAARHEKTASAKVAKAVAEVSDDPDVAVGKGALDVELSGQIARSALYADSGSTKRLMHVDNSNTPTLFRVHGFTGKDDDVKIGAVVELGVQSNASYSKTTGNSVSGVDFSTEDTSDTTTVNIRKADVYGQSKNWGRVSVGQGDSASYGALQQDLSGTFVALSAAIPNTGGLLTYGGEASTAQQGSFNIAASSGSTTSVTSGSRFAQVADVMNGGEGLGIIDRLRYDTPSILGLTASASYGENRVWDAALRYRANIAGWRMAMAGAFTDNTEWLKKYVGGAMPSAQQDTRDAVGRQYIYTGSVSVLSPWGVSLTGALSHRDTEYKSIKLGATGQYNLSEAELENLNGRKDLFAYLKLGYSFDLFSFGKTSMAIDYAMHNEARQKDESARSFGFGLVQQYPKAGADFFVSGRIYKLSMPSTNALSGGGTRSYSLYAYEDSTNFVGAEDFTVANKAVGTPDDIKVLNAGVRVRF